VGIRGCAVGRERGDGGHAFGWLALVAAGADRATQWLRRPRVTRTMARFSSTTLAVLGLATLIAVV
jgi:threonine/homoserine/homoserine lactone efflux protein